MLNIENLNVHYGVIHALKDVKIEVKEGQIVSLIGSNGAGKTTLLKTISGLLKSTSGSIVYLDKDILSVSAQLLPTMGLVQVPEGRRIFSGLTVYENLLMGAYLRKDKEGIKEDLDKIYKRFEILYNRRNQDAATLSGGEQQMLAISRALMARPKLLLLDEPSMGLAPLLVREIFNIIKEINATGTTILLVEQNAMQALKIADQAYVLETGTIVLGGTGAELLSSPEVQKVYLGG
ncbi:MAG: ABC transporter ATP-binding protein [Firmicutes bacterium GWF2_51_9]|nr:MAG: ABC transporter ATP-binding protein [Firmicutes bacterium GWF2_51_9]OGS58944.1 MAG: ABC transporter ATP-binding protein [Firmicutes bacterium GWE2_51_13]HAM62882.1 ABC transporter ATP-binding protein [Erysipelotrichaceae bacterium]HBZ40518.1 ABC transporter ATP-binding protein [Erysipelotrichaceae bacterium]